MPYQVRNTEILQNKKLLQSSTALKENRSLHPPPKGDSLFPKPNEDIDFKQKAPIKLLEF